MNVFLALTEIRFSPDINTGMRRKAIAAGYWKGPASEKETS